MNLLMGREIAVAATRKFLSRKSSDLLSGKLEIYVSSDFLLCRLQRSCAQRVHHAVPNADPLQPSRLNGRLHLLRSSGFWKHLLHQLISLSHEIAEGSPKVAIVLDYHGHL
jgi:hypothetical protein